MIETKAKIPECSMVLEKKTVAVRFVLCDPNCMKKSMLLKQNLWFLNSNA